jgi:NitT/TauT family transport system ATP-binding protein
MVELDSVSVVYSVPGGSFTAVEGASAFFPGPGITALIGPSGCGKTSLLSAIAGLVEPASGRILVAGDPLVGIRPKSALVFQDSGLLPWKTVRENAELPLLLRGLPRRERRARVAPILAEVGLSGFESFHPARLSGGMRQRLGLARALAQDPDLLLMDEPFSSLDALTREGLQDGLLGLAARHGLSVILVTHSIEEAAYLADSVYIMAKAPGRIARHLDFPPRPEAAAAGTRRNGAAMEAGIAPDAGFRRSEAYFSRCASLRAAFEGVIS